MEKKTLTPEEMSAKIDELTNLINTTQQENKTLKDQNTELQNKVNGLRIDGLTKQVEPKVEVSEEPITFDFDL